MHLCIKIVIFSKKSMIEGVLQRRSLNISLSLQCKICDRPGAKTREPGVKRAQPGARYNKTKSPAFMGLQYLDLVRGCFESEVVK